MINNYPDILTVSELMELLFISRNTAYELLRKGKIHSVKVGSVWRIPRFAIEEYIGFRAICKR